MILLSTHQFGWFNRLTVIMSSVNNTEYQNKRRGYFMRLWHLWITRREVSKAHFEFACGARTKIFIMLLVLLFTQVSMLYSLLTINSGQVNAVDIGQFAMLVLSLVLISVIAYYFQKDFLKPLSHLRKWVYNIRGGNLSAQIPISNNAEFADLAEDLNMVGTMLLRLSEDFEKQLQEHTQHITEKNRSLQILYNLSASTSYSNNLDRLLTTFLKSVTDVLHVSAAAIRLVDGDCFRLIKSKGMEDIQKHGDTELKIAQCAFSRDILEGNVVWEDQIKWNKQAGYKPENIDSIGLISVPLINSEVVLGVFNLFVDMKTIDKSDEMNDLMLSIGQHCGSAIDKVRLAQEAQRLKIIQEREHLSHELHDSLAQTLLSLRYQTRVLDDSLGDKIQSIAEQIERIESTVDEANTELRELITHFRAPIDKGGILVAIQQIVRRFQDDTDISIFLQKEWPDISLPGDTEIHILRIIQESLANIRKHSNATAVRILLRGYDSGLFNILIEDDGEGFDKPTQAPEGGDHIGLGIMKERAQKIGGQLLIDTEPGEGTRVVLKFEHPKQVIIQN